MVSEKEIFKAACGMNEEQESNSIIRVETKLLHLADGGSEEALSDLTLDGPCVNIHRSLRFTMIDLEFDNNDDPDYLHLASMLKDFTGYEQSMDVENDRIPALVLTIMPKELDGEYFICGMHGAWCLMPSTPEGPADTVRFIFDNELVHTYRINADVPEDDPAEDEELTGSFKEDADLIDDTGEEDAAYTEKDFTETEVEGYGEG